MAGIADMGLPGLRIHHLRHRSRTGFVESISWVFSLDGVGGCLGEGGRQAGHSIGRGTRAKFGLTMVERPDFPIRDR